MTIRFEWDEAKRKSNLRRHGIDFVGCEAVFEAYTLTVEDTRFDYGERRFVTLGLLEGRVVAVVHTESALKIRIISIRKATRHEQEAYFDGFRN
jgi:uncharacterized DUF497 family protein